jgi:caffeoyl-CoA O-methyltransferase/O-methyltransferase
MRPNVRFWDKMLPDQQEHAHLYQGGDFMRDLFQVVCRSSGINNPYDEFKIEQSDLFTVEEMASNPVAMRFLQFLIRVANVRRVLEIGAFIGLSTMSFAKALPPDGEVVSIEKFDKFATIARRNFELNGLSNKIKLLQGDAFEIIDSLPKEQKFDLIFVDGNKERYRDYVVKTEPLLSERGIMIVDDCFYHGDVLNETPSDEKGVGTKAFMDYAATSDGWLRIALPLSNGVFMMVRDKR